MRAPDIYNTPRGTRLVAPQTSTFGFPGSSQYVVCVVMGDSVTLHIVGTLSDGTPIRETVQYPKNREIGIPTPLLFVGTLAIM